MTTWFQTGFIFKIFSVITTAAICYIISRIKSEAYLEPFSNIIFAKKLQHRYLGGFYLYL